MNEPNRRLQDPDNLGSPRLNDWSDQTRAEMDHDRANVSALNKVLLLIMLVIIGYAVLIALRVV